MVQTPYDIRIISNLSSPDWWNIGLTSAAAIFGAFIGAAVSYWVALQTSNQAGQAAKEAKREDEESKTHRLGLALMQLVNAAAGYHLHAERHMEVAKKQIENAQTETWLLLKGFSGRPDEITINPNDLIIFLRAKKFDFISRAWLLVADYNAMIYNVEDYGKRREVVMEKLTPEKLVGLIGTFPSSDLGDAALAPQVAAIRDLAEQIRRQMKEVYDNGIKILDDFKPIVRTYFADPHFPVPAVDKAALD